MLSKPILLDLAERAGWTFVQAFTASEVIGHQLDLGALKIGAAAGAFAVLKFGLLAANKALSAPEAPKA